MENKQRLSENSRKMTFERKENYFIPPQNFNTKIILRNLRINKNKIKSLEDHIIFFYPTRKNFESSSILTNQNNQIDIKKPENLLYKLIIEEEGKKLDKSAHDENEKYSFEKIIQKNIVIKEEDQPCFINKNFSLTNFDSQSRERKIFESFKKKKSVTSENFSGNFNLNIPKNLIKIRKSFLKDLNVLFKRPKQFKIGNLLEDERTLVYYILSRKMKKNIFNILGYDKKIGLDDFTDLIDEYINFRSSKRFEEIFKLVFKSFINHKKDLIFGRNVYKKKDEFSLYIHYFNKTACELNIPIHNFMDPTKGKQKKKFKNFRKSYLKLILQSSVFKKDFVNYLTNDLQSVYFNKINQKLVVMVNKLLQIYKKKLTNEEELKKCNNDVSLLFKKVSYQYFIKENQCKITWSTREIIDSIFKLLRLINKIN